MHLKEARQQAIHELTKKLSNKIKNYSFNDACLDVDVLLMHLLKKNRVWILSNSDFKFEDKSIKAFSTFLEQRKTGLPIAYILNNKEFYGLNFYVSQSVLIPKPDTEILVEKAITYAQNKLNKKENKLKILDLCTGSGCIGIAVAHMLSQNNPNSKFEITFADILTNIIDVAKKNVSTLIPNVKSNFVICDLRKSIPQGFDLILCNPPYVPTVEANKLLLDGRSEPLLALDGGNMGTDLFEPLAKNIFKSLYSDGAFFIEAGEYNIKDAKNIFLNQKFYNLEIYNDLAGQNRILFGSKNK